MSFEPRGPRELGHTQYPSPRRHPGPLPWGEEGMIHRLSISPVPELSKHHRLNAIQTPAAPLPEGEGKGEGKRRFDSHRVSVVQGTQQGERYWISGCARPQGFAEQQRTPAPTATAVAPRMRGRLPWPLTPVPCTRRPFVPRQGWRNCP